MIVPEQPSYPDFSADVPVRPGCMTMHWAARTTLLSTVRPIWLALPCSPSCFVPNSAIRRRWGWRGRPAWLRTSASVGQPAEVAAVYVMLASDEASCISGARIAVTGGKPIL